MVAGALTAALFGDVAAMPRRIGPFTSLNQDPKSEVHLWCNRDLPVIVHPGLPLELPPSPGWRTEQVLLNKILVEVLPWNQNQISHPGIKIKTSLYYINLQYSVYWDNRFFGTYK